VVRGALMVCRPPKGFKRSYEMRSMRKRSGALLHWETEPGRQAASMHAQLHARHWTVRLCAPLPAV